ncbi:thyroxine-binding globulin-like [Leptodactylus fuscus]|uniref:thyroxine-binding globulin-like n=1 Tax=Leptodactylus fuscus TaxID=238119 RepID=UPI003F4EB387
MKILLFLCIVASLVHLGIQQVSYLTMNIPRNLPPKDPFDYAIVAVEYKNKVLKETYGDLIKSGSTIKSDGVTVFLNKEKIPLNKNAAVIATDFGNPTNVKTMLNNYVDEHTSGKIKHFFGDFIPNTDAVVLNYADNWKPLGSGGNQYNVQLTGQYNAMVNKDMGFTMIEIPKNKHLTALFVLPDEGKEQSVMAAVNSANLALWKKSMTLQSINLKIPKITLYTCAALTFETETSSEFEYQRTKYAGSIAATFP